MTGSACRTFLRALEAHAAADGEPQHARDCPACARRVAFARGIAGLLRVGPEAPAVLRDPAFLEGVYDRALADLEGAAAQGRLGFDLAAELRDVPVPKELPWPLQELQPRDLAGVLGDSPASAPSWMWRNVRHAIATGDPRSRARAVGARRRVFAGAGVRRLALAASLAIVALVGWRVGGSEGTPAELAIVFVPAAELSGLTALPGDALAGGSALSRDPSARSPLSTGSSSPAGSSPSSPVPMPPRLAMLGGVFR
ncbi:MAG: hypothetical protein AB7O97_12170 [Planctomycetota bacterium]